MKTIIVIGNGLAGTSAAIKAAESGIKVIQIAPLQSERAQSVMAMGGINAALDTKGQDDSVEQHFEDTMKSGCHINNEEAVRALTQRAPEIVRWLGSIGVNFTHDSKGNIDLRYFGGQKKMRTAYAGARTGRQIMSALIMKARKYESEGMIEKHIGWKLLSLVTDKSDRCVGVVVINSNTDEIRAYSADAVVLATGGPNSLFGKTSGSVMNDGGASGIAFCKGVEFANLEMIQYHPTTIATPGKRMLITEAARGEGGKLYTIKDGRKWYFMDEWYPGVGALMPRDVVSRSIYKVCNEMHLGIDGKNYVYLDITGIDKKRVMTALDEVVDTCHKYINLDPCTTPIPVYPGIHYFMGGIRTDASHHTNIKGLYAAGECSCQYHGANRLGGNSTLGAINGGLTAAEDIINNISELDPKMRDEVCDAEKLAFVEKYAKWKNLLVDNNGKIADCAEKLAIVMNKGMSIYRDEKSLNETLEEIEKIEKPETVKYPDESFYLSEIMPLTTKLAEGMVRSALERKESRGAHKRIDYPSTDDKNFRKESVAKCSVGSDITISFQTP